MPRSVAVAKGVDYFVPFVPDEQVTTEIDGSACLEAKTAAMRAHATQIVVEGDGAAGGGRFALSSGRWQPLLGTEFYTLLAGASGAASGTREHDLFAGLDGR
jgi:N-acetyl-1-D-myo-inositol-2-amino-2-deoxy-alpha-D-glucopyranoside deacetylase